MLSGGGSVPPVPLAEKKFETRTFWDPESDISGVHPEAGASPSPENQEKKLNLSMVFQEIFWCFGSGLVTYNLTTSRLVQPPARLVTRPHGPKISLVT